MILKVKAGAGCCRLPDQCQHKDTIYPCVFHTRMLMEGFPSGGGFHRPMIADKNVCVCGVCRVCVCVCGCN